MKRFLLPDYFKEIELFDDSLLDSLYFELNRKVYGYGEHLIFAHNLEKERNHFKSTIRKKLTEVRLLYKILLNKQVRSNGLPNIMSNAYFSVNKELINIGYNTFSPVWWPASDNNVFSSFKINTVCSDIRGDIDRKELCYLTGKEFLAKIEKFIDYLSDFIVVNKFSALFVPNDISLFENLAIKTFKKCNRPSFIFLHGLPGVYKEEYRSDYLIVWGEKIKENYVKSGIPENKIFVSGHPLYKTIDVNSRLRFDFSNVLVTTMAIPGGKPSDRGGSLVYLHSVQNALRKLGIQKAKLRPHPSERGNWYMKYVDKDFYYIDNEPLSVSLKNASLVIGGTSTILLESLCYGVNYVVYKPVFNNIDIEDCDPVSPFDGSDSRVHIAKNELELTEILKYKIKNDMSVIHDYIKTPFDISFLKKIL